MSSNLKSAVSTKKSSIFSQMVPKSQRLSVKERRTSKRRSNHSTTEESGGDSEATPPKTRSMSRREDESDGFRPPPLPQYSPSSYNTTHASSSSSSSHVLVKFLPPLEKGGKSFDIVHRHSLVGNKTEGGIVHLRRGNRATRKAVFFHEYTTRSEAVREMLKQMSNLQKQNSSVASQQSVASVPNIQSTRTTSTEGIYEELGRIKSMLATVIMNQSLILHHLFGDAGNDAGVGDAVEIPTSECPTTSHAVSNGGRKLSGMPKLTTMIDVRQESTLDKGTSRRTGGDNLRIDEEQDENGMAILQPMVPIVKLEPQPPVPEIKLEPSELDDVPPQMDLCL